MKNATKSPILQITPKDLLDKFGGVWCFCALVAKKMDTNSQNITKMDQREYSKIYSNQFLKSLSKA
ncbi:MAG: hypothetical protein NTY07_19160 [Bacteroidia bacterium]|nr:hypothetical protein [Bacteroidia bacterium]